MSANQCVRTAVTVIAIVLLAARCAPTVLTAGFSFAASSVNPLSIQFTDGSTAGPEPITAWLWDFGDGGMSTEQNPEHAYSQAGAFAVTLTVTAGTESDSITRTVTVGEAGEGSGEGEGEGAGEGQGEVEAPTAPMAAASSTVTQQTTVEVSGFADPDVTIEVQGGAESESTMADGDGGFDLTVDLQPDRLNRLFITAVNNDNVRSAPAVVEVVQDSTAPDVFIDFPEDGSELVDDVITVAGRVGDVLSGFMGLEVEVNGSSAQVIVGIGTNGSFERQQVALSDGVNTLTATATDAVGNSVSRSITVTRITPSGPRITRVSGNGQGAQVGTVLPEPIVVEVTEEDGSPVVDKMVEFRVTRSDGRLSGMVDGMDGTLRFQTRTDSNGFAQAFWRLGSDAGSGNNRVSVTSMGAAGAALFCASAGAAPPSQMNIGAGNNQRVEAGSPAPKALSVWVSDGDNPAPGVDVTFSADSGGLVNGDSETTVTTDITGHAAVSYIAGPNGGLHTVEADFAENAGLPARFVIRAVERQANRDTTLRGIVIDNSNRPIGGARCDLEIGGASVDPVFTDVNGVFEFTNLDDGPAHLHVDGLVATTLDGEPIPQGSFPSLAFEPVIIDSAENRLAGPVRLPMLDPANARTYDGTEDIVLEVAGLEGFRMTVAAGSMRRADGSTPSPGDSAVVALNIVETEDIPMPMPDGATPPFAWTLQPAGATFDPPVSVEYPNLAALPAGAVAYFLNFDHDAGQFVIVASGDVSEDGAVVRTGAGSGIGEAGWGGICPPYPPVGTVENDPCFGGKGFGGGTKQEGQWCVLQPEDMCETSVATCLPFMEAPIDTMTHWTIEMGNENETRVTNQTYEAMFCIDGSNRYKINPTMLFSHGVIELTMTGGGLISTEPDPTAGGNVGDCPPENPDKETCYCEIIADMADYSGIPGTSRGEWHTLRASQVHEEHHRDVDFITDMGEIWTRTQEKMRALSINCEIEPDVAQRFLQKQADLIFIAAELEYHFTRQPRVRAHNRPPLDDGAYQAGQQVLNEVIAEINLFALEQGFAPCPDDPLTFRKHDDLSAAGLKQVEQVLELEAAIDDGVLLVDETAQITVTAVLESGSADVTSGPRTEYASGNPEVATVSPAGTVSAVGTGFSIVTVRYTPEGLDVGLPFSAAIQVVVGTPEDQDADDLDDAFETENGLNPLDPSDALSDNDGDGLCAFEEFFFGTDVNDFDSDGDGVSDGDEAGRGTDPNEGAASFQTPGWVFSVNGQTVEAEEDGSFTLWNVTAPDNFGAGGPGTQPDGISDSFMRVVGINDTLEETWYAYSECFRIGQGTTVTLSDLVITTGLPPTPDSLSVSVAQPMLTEIGQTTTLQATAVLANGSQVNLVPRPDCATFHSSNPDIATIDDQGVIEAGLAGTAFISVVFEGLTAAAQVTVFPSGAETDVEGVVQFSDGSPVQGADVTILGQGETMVSDAQGRFAFENIPADLGSFIVAAHFENGTTLAGLTEPITPNAGALTDVGTITLMSVCEALNSLCEDSDGDCVPDTRELALGFDSANPDTDGNGISDGGEDPDGDSFTVCVELFLGTDPNDLDSDRDGLPDFEELGHGTDPTASNTDEPLQFFGDFFLGSVRTVTVRGDWTIHGASTINGQLFTSGEDASFTANGPTVIDGSFISAVENSTINLPNVSALHDTFLDLGAETGGAVNLPALTSFTNGDLGINFGADGTVNIGQLSNIDNTGILVEDGAVVSLPLVTSYTWDIDERVDIVARGTSIFDENAASQLALPNLETITLASNCNFCRFTIRASDIAQIDLSSLTGATSTNNLLRLRATEGGVLDVSALQTADRPSFEVLSGGTVLANSFMGTMTAGAILVEDATFSLPFVTGMDTVDITQRGAGMFNADTVTALHSSSMELLDASIASFAALTGITDSTVVMENDAVFMADVLESFTNVEAVSTLELQNNAQFMAPILANISNLKIDVGGGAALALPGVTSYFTDMPHSTRTPFAVTGFNAEGMSSWLSMPNLETLTYSEPGRITTLRIVAEDTGMIDFSGLTTVSAPESGNTVGFIARDADSSIDLSALVTFDPDAVTFTEENGGVIIRP